VQNSGSCGLGERLGGNRIEAETHALGFPVSSERRNAPLQERQANDAIIRGATIDVHLIKKGALESTSMSSVTLRALAEGVITQEEAEQFCPGYAQEMDGPPKKRPPLFISAAEVMKLPKRERDRIFVKAAIQAEKEYRSGPALTDFGAFGDAEFYDAHD